jgi:hypothetical protein
VVAAIEDEEDSAEADGVAAIEAEVVAEVCTSLEVWIDEDYN